MGRISNIGRAAAENMPSAHVIVTVNASKYGIKQYVALQRMKQGGVAGDSDAADNGKVNVFLRSL